MMTLVTTVPFHINLDGSSICLWFVDSFHMLWLINVLVKRMYCHYTGVDNGDADEKKTFIVGAHL